MNRPLSRNPFCWSAPILLAVCTSLLMSQPQSSANRPKFDVASIKPCKESTFGTNGGATSPGRLTEHCAVVANLVKRAYGMFRDGKMEERGRLAKVEGGPAWAYSDRFEIEAKADSGQSGTIMEGPMMQSLLEDRFKLKVHLETRDVPVYVLLAAKGGIKLRAAKQSCFPVGPGHPPPNLPNVTPAERLLLGCGHPDARNQEFHLHGATMGDLCDALSWIPFDRQEFVDKTGVNGRFDFDFKLPEFVPEEPGTAPHVDPRDRLIEAYRSALGKFGLKIDSGKGPGEFLIIDRLERPSAN
jgi:uncharacterized protein (TIGR03435 family)